VPITSAEILLFLMPLAAVVAVLLARQQHRYARLQREADTLRRSVLDLGTVFGLAPLGLAVLDLDLRYVRVNQILADLNGPSIEEHLGKTLYDMVPDVAPSAELRFQQVRDTRAPNVEQIVEAVTTAQPGVKRTFRESIYPLFTPDGALRGFALATEEITEQVRLNNALRDSEQRERRRAAELESVMDATPVAVFVASDRACRHVKGNAAARRLLRLDPGESPSITGPGIRAFDVLADGVALAPDELPLQRAAAHGEERWGQALAVRFSGGDLMHVIMNTVPLHDGTTGRLVGAAAAFIAVSADSLLVPPSAQASGGT